MINETILDSGLTVVTEAIEHVRSAAVGLWVRAGSRDEDEARFGASHFLEHLLFKGTRRRSARAIAEVLDEVGGELNAFTSKELTCFYARVIDRDLPLALDVLGDMLAEATNTAADVESERQVVLEEINIHLDSPDDLVHSDLAEVLLAEHPLALETLGSVASITTMDRDTIHDWFLHAYRPRNLVVAVAGNVEHDEVLALVEAHVGDLGRPGGDCPVRTAPTAWGERRATVRNRPTEQAHVAFGGRGLPMDDDRRYALRVLSTLFGGGMSSRLFQEVREERGLAYTTYSYASMFTDAGTWGAYAGTNPTKVDDLLGVMADQLDAVAADVTGEEVERAKGLLRGGTVLGLEDTGSRMNRLGKLVTLGLPVLPIDEILRRIDAVTLDDVREVAAEVLGGARCLAVVGPFDEDDASRFERYVA